MTETSSISEALAPLIVEKNIPLKTIAIIGEIITLDCRLRDYGGGPKTGEQLGIFLEAYDELLQRARTLAKEFSENNDREALMKLIPEIRKELAALG